MMDTWIVVTDENNNYIRCIPNPLRFKGGIVYVAPIESGDSVESCAKRLYESILKDFEPLKKLAGA